MDSGWAGSAAASRHEPNLSRKESKLPQTALPARNVKQALAWASARPHSKYDAFAFHGDSWAGANATLILSYRASGKLHQHSWTKGMYTPSIHIVNGSDPT